MKEDESDAQRAYKTYEEDEYTVTPLGGLTPVGDLVAHYFPRNIPPNEKTGEEGAQRQQDVGSERIAEVQKSLSHDSEMVKYAIGQRAEHRDDAAEHGDNPCPLVAGDMQFLMEESGAYLMHRNGGSERCQCQQRIEEQRDDISHHRNTAERLMEHIGQRDENERWP